MFRLGCDAMFMGGSGCCLSLREGAEKNSKQESEGGQFQELFHGGVFRQPTTALQDKQKTVDGSR